MSTFVWQRYKVVAQYALSGYDQPIDVSDYQLSKAIPDNLKSAFAYGGGSWRGVEQDYWARIQLKHLFYVQ